MPSPHRARTPHEAATTLGKSVRKRRTPAADAPSALLGRADVSAFGNVASVWERLKLIANSTGLGAHDAVTAGIQVSDMRQLMRALKLIGDRDVYILLGINARRMQRRTDRTLDAAASDRALRLVAITHQAFGVLGSQDAAERWLISPAMGLDDRRPIDLLRSSEGTDMVKTLLTRMDYGVYS